MRKQSSKYRGVGWSKSHMKWVARMLLFSGFNWSFFNKSERACAKAYDIKRMEEGKDPINIFKRLKKLKK